MTLLVTTSDPDNPQRGTLRCGERVYPCVFGRAGVTSHKREGDGATPRGIFPFRQVFYRADKLSQPRSSLSLTPIARDDGWCDAPGDRNYNKLVKHPYPSSAEHMWRNDGLYDVVVVIGHNDSPVVPEAGSAIFMHVAPIDGTPTTGCVALARDDLLALLAEINPESLIEIR